MGNAPSKGEKGGSAPQSPSQPPAASSSSSHGQPSSHQSAAKTGHTQPRRKESIHRLSGTASVKASASLESAIARLPSSSSTSQTSAVDSLRSQGRAQQPPSPAHPQAAINQAAPPPEARTPKLRAADSQHTDIFNRMGNKESKPTLERSPHQATEPKPIEKTADTTASTAHVSGLPLPEDDYSLPPASYSFSRPPRLPLPIEEELYTPGSPVILPQDLPSEIEPIEGDDSLDKSGRQTSMLSSTTADDDEIPDDIVFQDSAGQGLVPTLIEWRQGGDRVYVTGTFVDWDKKVRLHRNGPSTHKDAFSAILNLPPGTHHCRFIVDGDLRLSEALPTAVDFTNFLTNYIEVAPPTTGSTPSAPVDVPPGKAPAQPAAAKLEYKLPPGLHPPQVLPPTPELVPISKPPAPEKKKEDESEKDSAAVPATLAPGPHRNYHREIPAYLLDLDAPDESEQLSYANAVATTLPTPPTLPMFLAKSILNGATPMKDDASVLIMPNHTVLNHLATSSIRQKVLATSATTRYKRKFLTTIMYKPTSEVGD